MNNNTTRHSQLYPSLILVVDVAAMPSVHFVVATRVAAAVARPPHEHVAVAVTSAFAILIVALQRAVMICLKIVTICLEMVRAF